MLTHAEISFTRKGIEDGFGFSCMKAAYHMDIRGRMDYNNVNWVSIQVEGEKGRIEEFIRWIESQFKDATTDIVHNNHLINNVKFKEFDIYLHSV